ncbi:hypothetical protein GZ77_26135 [Endozoicomonas montiporae]|uniref:Uncharacterized protein n=1 Tax=Endozoicomonas montiporae TaxID=1027273 RepID=A0A081MYL8_9GAMM|nr:hypothetical protein [Endozoicomonas montiporae]KEQ11291.1 hypothetical protein GZ77_26135 [Endozoicomonas montiporae]
MAKLVTKDEFAETVDISARTVERWMKKGLPTETPASTDKGRHQVLIPLALGVQWATHKGLLKSPFVSVGSDDGEETTFEQEELMKLRAERKLKEHEEQLKALELGEKDGRLIDLHDTEMILAESMTQLSMIIRPVGRKVIPKVKTARNEAEGLSIWDDEVTRAFTVAAEMLRQVGIDGHSASEASEPGGEDS